MPWYFREKRNLKKYLLIFATDIKCVTLLDEEVILYTKTREGQTFAPCVTLWYFSPSSAFLLFSSSWPIYNSLMANIHNKNKCASHCLLFTKNGAHVSFPVEQGEKYFCICDSSTNTPPALLPPPSLSFHLPLWFLLSLSLNVRWEEGARIIGHASVGLFDHVTLWRLHTYVPLNKPSNVAPEAEHGSKGSEGPVLCNDGKMEQFCLCWLYLCVCVCVQLSAARELWGLQLGLHFPVVHFLSRPPTTKKKKARETTYPLSKCPWLKH